MSELIEAATNEIAEYSPVEAGLAELRRKYSNVVVDVSTPKTLDDARKVRAEIREPRYETEKIRQMLKAPALAHAKLIDTEAKRITAELLAIETPWDTAIKAEEARKETERAEREAAERARITAIHARIADITSFGLLAIECRTADRVQGLIDKVTAINLENFEEFDAEAKAAHENTLARLEQIHAAKFSEEAERARVKSEQAAERVRLDEQRAAQEALRKAQEADAAAERERLAQVARLQQETAAEAQRQRDEQAAADKTRRDQDAADLAERRAAFEREQAAARELLDAQARELAAQQDALEAPKPVSPAAELAAAQANPDGAYLSPTAQALNEQQGAERFQAAHPDIANVVDTTAPAGPDPLPFIKARAPSDIADADLIWTASRAVADEFSITQEQAIERLSAVVWTL